MARKLRVLSLVHNLFFGGDQTRLLAYARSYDRERFEHYVASIHLPDEEYVKKYGSMREEYASHGVEVIELGRHHHATDRSSMNPVAVLKTLRSLQQLANKLKSVIGELKIDLIDARLSSPIFVGAVTGRLCGIPSVGTTYSFEGKPNLLTRCVTQLSFAMSDAIITDSEIWRTRIEKAILWPTVRVENIPNGIFAPIVNRSADETRRILDLPSEPDTRIICQVSRLVEYKGHMTLLDAARRVLERHPNAYFLCLGHEESGGYTERLKARAEELEISGRVGITGYDGSIGDVWNIVDVNAHASNLDSAPNAIIEGMSMSKPAVVTDVGGIPQLVEHGKTAIVVPRGDSDALAAGIMEVLDQPGKAKAMGAAARRRYEENYTPSQMARRHEALFEELCRRRGAR